MWLFRPPRSLQSFGSHWFWLKEVGWTLIRAWLREGYWGAPAPVLVSPQPQAQGLTSPQSPKSLHPPSGSPRAELFLLLVSRWDPPLPRCPGKGETLSSDTSPS